MQVHNKDIPDKIKHEDELIINVDGIYILKVAAVCIASRNPVPLIFNNWYID